MIKEKLSRHFWLKNEITKQYMRLEKLEVQQRRGLVADTVQDYKSGKPLTIKIEGYEDRTFMSPLTIKLLKKEIEKNINELEKLALEAEQIIQGVEDPRLRELLRSRFIDCLKWEDVGKKNYISAEYARELVGLFLRKA